MNCFPTDLNLSKNSWTLSLPATIMYMSPSSLYCGQMFLISVWSYWPTPTENLQLYIISSRSWPFRVKCENGNCLFEFLAEMYSRQTLFAHSRCRCILVRANARPFDHSGQCSSQSYAHTFTRKTGTESNSR